MKLRVVVAVTAKFHIPLYKGPLITIFTNQHNQLFSLIQHKRKLFKAITVYVSMPMNKALDKLCEILIEQNVAINSAVERKTINWDMVVEYNKDAIKSIKKLRKKLVNESKVKPNISVKIQ